MKITLNDGTQIWRNVNGQVHRTDGPAKIFICGTKKWYKNGKLHRTKGPAIECANGEKHWYYKGEYIDCNSQDEFEKTIHLKYPYVIFEK